MAEAGAEVAELGAEEVAEGLTRVVVSEGMADLAAAEAAREASATLAREGVLQVAEGAADLGASEAFHATAEAVEDRADAETETGDA
jgi:hypothetical protein